MPTKLFRTLLLAPLFAAASAFANPTPQQWLEYEAPRGKANGLKATLIAGDEEYKSEEMLPAFARILSKHHGFDTQVLFAQDPDAPGVVNPAYYHNIPGLQALRDSDLAVFFIRWRDLPDEQMEEIESYLKSGRPVIGIRTANHGFKVEKYPRWSHWDWQHDGSLDPAWEGGFGMKVLGTVFTAHHGHHKRESTRGIVAPGQEEHPILNGIEDGDVWGSTDVYGTPLPLPGDSQALLFGQVLAGMNAEAPPAKPPYENRPSYLEEGDDKNDPMMPVALIRTYQLAGGKRGEAFCSTMGSSQDFANEGFRRLLTNAALYLVDLPVPEEGAKVDLVGSYTPSPFKDDPVKYRTYLTSEFWENKNLKISSMQQSIK